MKALILQFADLNMVAFQKGVVLGDAYEYLIGQFAMESGKKVGGLDLGTAGISMIFLLTIVILVINLTKTRKEVIGMEGIH